MALADNASTPTRPPLLRADFDQQSFVIKDPKKLRLGYEWKVQLWRRRVPKKVLLTKFRMGKKDEVDKLILVRRLSEGAVCRRCC